MLMRADAVCDVQETVTLTVDVKLTVTAEVVASQSTWGSGTANERCTDIASTFSPNVTAIVGRTISIAFTLCDFEALPVASLYATFGGRSFSGTVRQLDSSLTTALNVRPRCTALVTM